MPRPKELGHRKTQGDSSMFAVLVFFLMLSAGVFAGAVMASMMAPRDVSPFAQMTGLLMQRDRNVPAANDQEAADACVPVLVRNDTRHADVLATFADKSLDTRAAVTVSDRTFSVDASAAVSNLTFTFNPPVTVPGGSTTTVPLPAAPSAVVRPTGRVVCEVRPDGMCAPTVETPSYAIWSLDNGPASIAVRAEHQHVAADEVRVDFQVKGAIDGGAVTGAGAHLVPPQDVIQYTNGGKTVTPFVGSASWRCVWAL